MRLDFTSLKCQQPGDGVLNCSGRKSHLCHTPVLCWVKPTARAATAHHHLTL